MIILGIDPGYAIIGYGIIEYENSMYIYNKHGAIITDAKDDFASRLEIIFNQVSDLINEFNPSEVAIEKLYFQSNHKTAIDVAQARGVILLAARKYKIPIYEYTPLEVKISITGYGKAQKHQIMEMTKKLLLLKDTPKPDDAADALAIAICHSNCFGKKINKLLMKRR
ncbi:MAG: crossover junction endodeoxyribonuclease RuvC [Oscillospiraceae bacterium]|jgi:crossover junction endodeoxyribonuclease RuvC|nr:crossover junction endodeoxyribonuclease RuvC [Oscillospiraceae bacterium]